MNGWLVEGPCKPLDPLILREIAVSFSDCHNGVGCPGFKSTPDYSSFSNYLPELKL